MQVFSQKRITSNIIKGSLGNMIEWFDWYIYASFAIYFAGSFFPTKSNRRTFLSAADFRGWLPDATIQGFRYG